MSEEMKERLKANEVEAPTLFVGVGGTGCKIIHGVEKRCKSSELQNVNFLYLDTNVNDLNEIKKNGKGHVIQTSNTQTVGSYLDCDVDARKNWFPKNAVMYDKTVSEGAGQVRAISRLALNSTIKTGRIRPLYDSIDDLFRKTGKDTKQAMRCVIASTASGGTGSGMILPLSMFVRDYVKEKYPNTSLIVRAMILLPETLDSVIDSQTERDSQARNAYATIKELNAFMMKGSGFIDVDEDLKQYSGLHVDVPVAGSDKMKSLSLLPMDFCFLMDGQDSEDSTMISINQYREQASQALYEQNIGPMSKDAFSVEDNIIKEMTKPGNYGRNRFGGMGAGVIRYPYEDIADYVAYDLALDSIGGDKDASKWVRYDIEYKLEEQDARNKGLAKNEYPSIDEFYVSKILSSGDTFSKELRVASQLNDMEEKINDYIQTLSDSVREIVDAQSGIRSAKEQVNGLNREIDYSDESKCGKATTNLNNLQAYENAVKSFAEKAARGFAESVFINEKKTVNVSEQYYIEKLLWNSYNEIAHPNAARFILYSLKNALKEKIPSVQDDVKRLGDTMVSICENGGEGADLRFTGNSVQSLADVCSLEKSEGEAPSIIEKLKGYNKLYDVLNEKFPSYYLSIERYGYAVAELAVFQMAYEYVGKLCDQYEDFFASFKSNVKELARSKDDLIETLKYQKGNSTVNICATEELLHELSRFSLQKVQGQTTMLNTDVNGAIFDAVKKNVYFKIKEEKADGAFIEEDDRVNIFRDILLGYFKRAVREKCEDINKDIIGAIELEYRLKERIRLRKENGGNEQVFEQVSLDDVKNRITETIKMGERIAAPSVQRVVNEEPREIKLCAYNSSLLDNRRIRVKDLITKGTATDTVSKYEIHFFNALYNLTPDKIKKFAAPFETETGVKQAGTYQKAYHEYSRFIGPDSTKNAVISTHIDKRWDSIKSMPEIDFGYQKTRIMKIHKAFIYGIIHNAIQQRQLSVVANGKKIFLYKDSDNRDVELVVPNGTLCDEFYEILDALYVNSKVVEDISVVKGRKRALSEAKNCNYEDTEFFRDMANFNLLKLIPDYENEVADRLIAIDPDANKERAEKELKALRNAIRESKLRRNEHLDDADYVDENGIYVENHTSLFAIPLLYYCTSPNSGRYLSEIIAMVNAVIDVFREEYSKWEKTEDVKFVLCNRLTDELALLERNYHFYQELLNAPAAKDNPVIDVIQREVKQVILEAPEPEDYEVMLDKISKEFMID